MPVIGDKVEEDPDCFLAVIYNIPRGRVEFTELVMLKVLEEPDTTILDLESKSEEAKSAVYAFLKNPVFVLMNLKKPVKSGEQQSVEKKQQLYSSPKKQRSRVIPGRFRVSPRPIPYSPLSPRKKPANKKIIEPQKKKAGSKRQLALEGSEQKFIVKKKSTRSKRIRNPTVTTKPNIHSTTKKDTEKLGNIKNHESSSTNNPVQPPQIDKVSNADVLSLLEQMHAKIDSMQADINYLKERQTQMQSFPLPNTAVHVGPGISNMTSSSLSDALLPVTMSSTRAPAASDLDIDNRIKQLLYFKLYQNVLPSL